MARADRSTRWREIVEGLEEGRESVAAYCRRKGVTETSFYRWRKRLRNEEAARPRFVPVEIVDARAVGRPAVEAGVEIELRGDRRVRVSAGFDADVLRRAVGVLESC